MPDAAALEAVFDRLQASLARYAPPLVVRSGGISGKRDYQLWSEKRVEIDGRKRDEVYFAGVIGQKGYVGFYFMPVYSDPEQKAMFAPELLSLLKGKSCFHIKRFDDELAAHVDEALAKGFALYVERGWIDQP
jgi:hypothetical protein